MDVQQPLEGIEYGQLEPSDPSAGEKRGEDWRPCLGTAVLRWLTRLTDLPEMKNRVHPANRLFKSTVNIAGLGCPFPTRVPKALRPI